MGIKQGISTEKTRYQKWVNAWRIIHNPQRTITLHEAGSQEWVCGTLTCLYFFFQKSLIDCFLELHCSITGEIDVCQYLSSAYTELYPASIEIYLWGYCLHRNLENAYCVDKTGHKWDLSSTAVSIIMAAQYSKQQMRQSQKAAHRTVVALVLYWHGDWTNYVTTISDIFKEMMNKYIYFCYLVGKIYISNKCILSCCVGDT